MGAYWLFFSQLLIILLGATNKYCSYAAVVVALFVALIIGMKGSNKVSPIFTNGIILLLAFQNLAIGIGAHSAGNYDSSLRILTQIPILVGVSSAVCSYLYMDLPSWVEILFSSALTSGSFFAVFLGLVFKLGISRHRYGDLSQKSLSDYMEDAGKAWTLDKNQIHKIVDELEEYDAKEISLTLSRSWDSLTVLLKLDGKEEKKIMYQLL